MFLKNKIRALRLPVLERKWNRIVQRQSYKRNSFELKQKIKEGLKTKTPKLIAEELGVNVSYISYVKNGERR